MSWRSLPHEPRKLRATEARLDAIYSAARRGLKGDTLAFAAGMMPAEYRQLIQFDPIAEMAELKGRADGEMELSGILHRAAERGDTKAALDLLKHVHGWVAKQAVDVNVEQTISIRHALDLAQQRVLEGAFTVLEDESGANANLLPQRRDGIDGEVVGVQHQGQPA